MGLAACKDQADRPSDASQSATAPVSWAVIGRISLDDASFSTKLAKFRIITVTSRSESQATAIGCSTARDAQPFAPVPWRFEVHEMVDDVDMLVSSKPVDGRSCSVLRRGYHASSLLVARHGIGIIDVI